MDETPLANSPGGILETEEVVIKVPIYLANNVAIGTATISPDGKTVSIYFPDGTAIQELIKEQVIGLNVMYLNADLVEDILNNKEKTDG